MRKIFFLFTIFFLGLAVPKSVNAAAVINVQSGESIQTKCLDVVQAGDKCIISPGNYNESLILKNSGTSSLPIEVVCATEKTCTVNSGTNRTIETRNNTHYYIIDGIRLIGTANNEYGTLYFGQGTVWSASQKDLGNNGFIIRNCYVEGNLKFYGHDNLVENCEFNGKNFWQNGVSDWYASSYNNTYRNNTIYSYPNRGIWSMQYTDNIIIEGNKIYDSGKCIDTDGAGYPVTNHLIRNNTFTNCDMGIELENTFDSVIEKNIFKNNKIGIHVSGNGEDTDFHTVGGLEWRDKPTNTVIKNNVLYDIVNTGVTVTGQTGGIFTNNTINYSINSTGYYSGLGLLEYPTSDVWHSDRWVIKNNIIYNKNSILFNIKTSGSVINYNYYSPNSSFIIKDRSINTFTTKSFSDWQSLGYDTNGNVGQIQFVDPTNGDFRLQQGSPACTLGEGGSYVGAFDCSDQPINPSDLEPDGDVDIEDFLTLVSDFGLTGILGWIRSDIIKNGVVDIFDFNKLITNFGM